MARLTPITTLEIKDGYLADKIYGFPAAPAMPMISVGKVSKQPKRAFSAKGTCADLNVSSFALITKEILLWMLL
jgi:hypothetical protein